MMQYRTVFRSGLQKAMFSRNIQHLSLSDNQDVESKHLRMVVTSESKPKVSPDDLVFGKVMTDHMLELEWNKGHGWNAPVIKPHTQLNLHPMIGALQYGGQIYEGMKAFYGIDEKIRIFRPEMNMSRFNRSAERMCLPVFNERELLTCILELIKLEKDWIPKDDGCSLYIRPSLISLDTFSPCDDIKKALLFVILSPVGSYFKGGAMKPVSLLSDHNFVRAWPGGVGEYKAGGNYGPTVYLQREAAEKKGFDQILWLYNDEVTEAGTMNILMHWINENGDEELITPPLDGLILHGITRKSFLELAVEWDEFLVSEKKFTMKDVITALNENRVKSIFACGTACIVCPIHNIWYEGKALEIPCDIDVSLAKRFYDTLRDIQYGRITHSWAPVIC